MSESTAPALTAESARILAQFRSPRARREKGYVVNWLDEADLRAVEAAARAAEREAWADEKRALVAALSAALFTLERLDEGWTDRKELSLVIQSAYAALAAAEPPATSVIDPVIDPKVQEPATSDREALVGEWSDCRASRDAMGARVVELAVERDALRRALIAYGHHAASCSVATFTVCSCGFTAVLRPLVDPPATSEPTA